MPEHLKKHVYSVPQRNIECLVAGHQAGVTTVNANILRHVRVNAVRSTAVCREMGGGCFDHRDIHP
jgi:hypothetical protein